MKIFLGLIAIWSFSLLACPNLEGTYPQCPDDLLRDKDNTVVGGRVHNIIIEQDKVDGRDRYKFKYRDDSDEVVRSYSSAIVGKAKIIEKFDRWSRIDIKHEITAKCEGNSLLINSKIYHNGKLFADTHEVLTKQEKNMAHTIKGMTNGQNFSRVMDCQP